MKKIKLLNNEINYYETDKFNEKKKNIFFCHEFGSNLQSFIPIMTKLNNYFNCYSIDYPNHGNSEGSLKEMKIRFFIKTIKAFLKEKNINKVTLIGHSMSGAVVSFLEKENFVEKVILIAPVNPATYDIKKDSFKKVVVKSEKESRETVKRRAYVKKVIREVMSRKNQNNILWNYIYFKKPTLILLGLNDKVVPPKKSVFILRKLIDNVIIKVIPHCSHNPHEEKVNEVYEIIFQFLKR